MIVGGTVEELDARMSFAERQNWVRYVQKNGPLNPMLRLEGAIARAIIPFLKRGTKVEDLLPWPVKPVADPSAIAGALMGAFRAGDGTGKKLKYKVKKWN